MKERKVYNSSPLFHPLGLILDSSDHRLIEPIKDNKCGPCNFISLSLKWKKK